MTTISHSRKPAKNSVLIKVESDKKLLHVTIAAAIFLLSFTAQKFTATKATAEANQVQGIYIFTDSKPVSPYNYLGSVKVTAAGSGQYQPVRDKLIKKIKKEYPQADGIIFYFIDGTADKADAIQFK